MKTRFCLDSVLNKEHQLHILEIITSFLSENREDEFMKHCSVIQVTLTKRRHIGKILIHRFKESKISSFKQHTVKKLSVRDWIPEVKAHYHYGVIRPLNIVSRLMIDQEKRNILERLRKHFVSMITINYSLT
jgi:hypothetical protein